MAEAAEYDLTARGKHANAPNTMLFSSLDKMYACTTLDQVSSLLLQPSLFIAGIAAGALWPKRAVHRGWCNGLDLV